MRPAETMLIFGVCLYIAYNIMHMKISEFVEFSSLLISKWEEIVLAILGAALMRCSCHISLQALLNSYMTGHW